MLNEQAPWSITRLTGKNDWGFVDIGKVNSLSNYDSAYLELAMRQRLSIATLDGKLLKATRRVDIPILAV